MSFSVRTSFLALCYLTFIRSAQAQNGLEALRSVITAQYSGSPSAWLATPSSSPSSHIHTNVPTTLSTLPSTTTWTSTLSNDAVVQYAASASATIQTTIQAGKSMSIGMEPTAGVNVGRLRGNDLYTSVSSAIKSACGEKPTGTQSIIKCTEEAKIDNIVWLDDEGNYEDTGSISMVVDEIKIHDEAMYEALINSIAAVANATSLLPQNTVVAPTFDGAANSFTGYRKRGQIDPGDMKLTSIPGAIQAIFTEQDSKTGGIVDEQHLMVKLEFESAPASSYNCSTQALIMDSIALALFLVPGLGEIAGPALGALAALSAESVSLLCEIQEIGKA